VGHHQKRPVVLRHRALDGLEAVDVQVVRGLVEDEEPGGGRAAENAGEPGAHPLAAAQPLDRREGGLAREQVACEHVAGVSLVPLRVRGAEALQHRAAGLEDPHGLVEPRHRLPGHPGTDHPAVGLQIAHDHPEQRRLPAPVRPGERDPLRPPDDEIQPVEKAIAPAGRCMRDVLQHQHVLPARETARGHVHTKGCDLLQASPCRGDPSRGLLLRVVHHLPDTAGAVLAPIPHGVQQDLRDAPVGAGPPSAGGPPLLPLPHDPRLLGRATPGRLRGAELELGGSGLDIADTPVLLVIPAVFPDAAWRELEHAIHPTEQLAVVRDDQQPPPMCLDRLQEGGAAVGV
jgi:hypothetical protein